MEGSAATDPKPTGEESEITSDVTMEPGRAEPTTIDSSGGGGGSAASFPWSVPLEQRLHNFKENWRRACNGIDCFIYDFDRDLEDDPRLSSVMAILRVDLCLTINDLEIDWLNTDFRMTSLDLAILVGDLKMVQEIFERCFVPDDKTWWGIEMTGPLHFAVTGGDSDIVDALLEKGADVNAPNEVGRTPVDVACKIGSVDMLLKLLGKDAKKRDPLHVAVWHGDIDFMNKLPSLNVNAVDFHKKTPLHYLAAIDCYHDSDVPIIVQLLAQDKALDMKVLDYCGLSAFYVAVLYCNTPVVIALLDSFKDQIRLNEECDEDLGPPIQIAFEGGVRFKDIERALMECESVKGYMERLYKDRQVYVDAVYVDAANVILVGAALIAGVTFASWLQPPLNYTSYFGEGYSNSVPASSTSDLNYADVEHNIALRAFWVFNALSFYFAIATVVCGARSVLPRSHLFIKKTVEKLRTNLLVTSTLLACSVLFVIIAFAIAGTIVLTPLLKYQWFMIVPTIVGGLVCIISLVFLVKSMVENYFWAKFDTESQSSRKTFLEKNRYEVDGIREVFFI